MRIDELLQTAAEIERTIANGPIVPSVTHQEIRNHLNKNYDFKKPLPIEDVVSDIQRLLQNWQVQVTHPRYLGLFNPSVTTASIIGDTLAAAYNPQLATWRTSPVANAVEQHTLAWMTGKFGLPDDTFANFTSGGAESNLTAVVLALTKAFPDYGMLGLQGVRGSPTIYLTEEAHNSFNKIAHMSGLGRQALRIVGTDGDTRIDMTNLIEKIAVDRKSGCVPFMVIGTVGTTAGGIIDPLPALARFCRSEDVWLHIDAAWGGSAAISPRLKQYLEGIENADSVSCDAHKWLSVPMSAGMFFCRHPGTVRAAFQSDNVFMPAPTRGTDDPYATTVQWSRRFIGLKLFVSLANLGETGYIEMIERQARLGDVLRDYLRRDGWEIVNSTPLPLVCFTVEGLNTSKFLAELYQSQVAWISDVQFLRRNVLRACITSFKTTESDIRNIVSEMGKILRRF